MILRRAREQRRRAPDDVARVLGVSLPQVSRLDSGARGYPPKDVRKLAEWYGMGAAEADRLVALAVEARKRAWWQQIPLPDGYRTLIGLEQGRRSAGGEAAAPGGRPRREAGGRRRAAAVEGGARGRGGRRRARPAHPECRAHPARARARRPRGPGRKKRRTTTLHYLHMS